MIWNLLKKLLCKRKQNSSIEDSISIDQLILNAKAGDAEAQYNLGICYETGNCIEQDTEQALYWYQKSVDQGFALAKYALSKMYAEGNGVDKDLAKATTDEEKTLILVPGVAFTKDGNRLGRGKGFYDIYLSKIIENCGKKNCCFMGVCFDVQKMDFLPIDIHDVKMDKVI